MNEVGKNPLPDSPPADFGQYRSGRSPQRTNRHFHSFANFYLPRHNRHLGLEFNQRRVGIHEPGPVQLPPNGSIKVTPQMTTTYTITAAGTRNSASAEVTVTVVPPPTVTFYSSPGIVKPGEPVTLYWSAYGATTCSLSPDLGTVATSGSTTVTPHTTTTYSLSASGIGGITSTDVTITVADLAPLFTPGNVARGNLNTTLPNRKQIVRSSSGQIYFFAGDRNLGTNLNGWIEVSTSADGNSWSHYHHDEWYSGAGLGLAVDSNDIIHTVAYDWNLQPYYQKFHSVDSSGSAHTWEAKQLVDQRSGSASSRCAIAIDGNDNPHLLYQVTERLKGISYDTLYYANYIDGSWNTVAIIPVETRPNVSFFDIAIGPDNIPYILLAGSILKGDGNNPTNFETFTTGGNNTSFVIHDNGDIRISLKYGQTYCHYLHDSTQPWSSDWSLLSSDNSYGYGTLVLVDDIPYNVFELFKGIAVQREFEEPVLVSEIDPAYIASSDYAGRTPTTRWCFYNHHAPHTIDIGMRSWLISATSSTNGTYYWYSGYPLELSTSFDALLTNGLAPFTVQFADRSTAAISTSIVDWEWDFDGDGNIDSHDPAPTFTYDTAGAYTVSLTVVDSEGNVRTVTKPDFIIADGDADGDLVWDSRDNCPELFNATQIDLDGDGIGYACDTDVNLLNQANHILGVRKITDYDSNLTNVTGVLRDNDVDSFITIQHPRQYDVLDLESNTAPSGLAMIGLDIFVSDLDAGSQAVRIYAYDDATTINNGIYVDYNIVAGWNQIDISALLPIMINLEVMKIRVAALDSWINVAETAIRATSSVGVDYMEISVDPQTVDFGSVPVGDYVWNAITISNNSKGYETLEINNVSVEGNFGLINAGKCIRSYSAGIDTCVLYIGFAPQSAHMYSGNVFIESNDRDNPLVAVNLSAVGLPQASTSTLQGMVTDSVSAQPIPGIDVEVTQQRVLNLSPEDIAFGPDVWTTADLEKIKADDGSKVISFPQYTEEAVQTFNIRNPYSNNDPIKLLWNGTGEERSREIILAQSFQAGLPGQLGKVRLKLGRESCNAGAVRAFISNELGGNKESLLGESEVLPAVDINPNGAWVDFNFDQPVYLETNKTYYLILSSTANTRNLYYAYPANVFWYGGNATSYSNGDGFSRDDSVWNNINIDFTFETYMDGILDQQFVSEGTIRRNSFLFSSHGVGLRIFNRLQGVWDSLAWQSYDIYGYHGYDDESFDIEILENPGRYYDENGWISVQAVARYSVTNGSFLIATDYLNIEFLKSTHGQTSQDGTYSVSGLMAGDFTVGYHAAGYYPTTMTGTLGTAETQTLNAQLESVPPLEMTITAPTDGELVYLACIRIEGTVTNNSVITVNGENDTASDNSLFSISACSLVAGENILIVTATDEYGQVVSRTISVVGDWGTIQGTVTDAETGQPIPDVYVNEVPQGYDVIKTDDEGSYQLTKVRVGDLSVSAKRHGYEDVLQPVHLNRGEVLAVDLSMSVATPVITDIFVTSITKDSAKITWYTGNVSADTLIEYGETTEYGNAVDSPVWPLVLTGLEPQTNYHFRFTLTDRITGTHTSTSQDYTFRTLDNVKILSTGIAAVTGHSMTVNWNTDVPSDSFLEYGKTTAYGMTVASASSASTSHSARMEGLEELTRYYFRVTANDIATGGSSDTGNTNYQHVTGTNVNFQNVSAISITGQTATINWTTDIPATSFIDYGETTEYGFAVANTTLTQNHSLVLDDLLSGQTYHFRITSADGEGYASSTLDYTFETDQVMTFSIDSPVSGETVYRPTVNVVGTINHLSGDEIGARVSSDPDLAYSIPAQVNGNTFFVNNLPLIEGVNTITAIAKDANGNVAQTSITITCDTVGRDWLELSLLPENGAVDPGAATPKTFQSTLQVNPHLRNQPVNSSWSIMYTYSGTGNSPKHYTLDSSSADGLEHQLTFYDPGVYTFYFTLIDTDANQEYTGELMVNVYDWGEIDVRLQQKWDGIKSALALGDVEGGLAYFLEASKENYRGVLEAISTELPQIIPGLQNIEMVYAKGDRVKYRLNRTQVIGGTPVSITYYIYFVRDNDTGLWKVEQF